MRAMGASRVIGWCISGTRIDKAYPYSPMVIARIIKELRLPVILFGAGKDAEAAEVVGNQVVIQNGSGEGLHFAIEADYHKSSPELRAKLGLVPDVTNWPVRRGLAQVQLCDLVIGPDTGFMWGVAMEKMPKIVMLSHASQENITKHWHNTITLHADQKRVPCWPCHKLHDGLDTCVPNKDNNGAACISDISVEEILRKAKVSLNSIQET
jgi:ADP-heptose:LPS heptosyltransferase